MCPALALETRAAEGRLAVAAQAFLYLGGMFSVLTLNL